MKPSNRPAGTVLIPAHTMWQMSETLFSTSPNGRGFVMPAVIGLDILPGEGISSVAFGGIISNML